jgi:hypothetical protein
MLIIAYNKARMTSRGLKYNNEKNNNKFEIKIEIMITNIL